MTNVSTPMLDIDMGNSRIKWRLTEGEQSQYGACLYQQVDWFELRAIPVPPRRVRISCVAGEQRRQQIAAHCRRQWQVEPEFAEVKEECGGVKQAYKVKERLGVDRWLGLLAARQQVGGCVLVSCGSAVTVDLLKPDGNHLGGYIVPGIAMMHRGLFSGTDAVKVEAAHQLGDLRPGRDTIDAVNKGIVAMVVGLIEHARAIYLEETGDRPPFLITGGDGETVQRFLDCDSIYNPYLVLDGLAVALP